MAGAPLRILYVTFLGLVAVFCIACAFEGIIINRRVGMPTRIALFAAALAQLLPWHSLDLIGVALLVVLILYNFIFRSAAAIKFTSKSSV